MVVIGFISIFLLGLMFIYRRKKGPIWALCISWLICILPIAINLIDYTYFSTLDVGFAFLLMTYLLCFVVGVVLHDSVITDHPVSCAGMDVDCRVSVKWAWIAWFIGVVGTLCTVIDFVFFKDVGLDDLTALRGVIVDAAGVTWFARIASILTWGCLYCFAFALYFRDVISRRRFAFFILPIAGYFLTALLSAGRQAALQILIFALLIELLKKARCTSQRKMYKISWVLILGVSFAMVIYMGYVAIARNDGLVSTDKTETLAILFNYTLSSTAEEIFGVLGYGVKATLIEALVYFSHSLALFSKFLTIEFTQLYAGAMTFPLIMHQLDSLTGISVVDALETKIYLMNETGEMGAGWTTAISDYMMDFGHVGAAVVLFLQGFYTTFAWRRAVRGNDFNEVVVALVLLTFVIYLPFFAATREANLLLLWFFSTVILLVTKYLNIYKKIETFSDN